MSISVNFVFKDQQEIKRELRNLSRRFENAGNAGIYALGVLIMREAKERTPVDTGALKASGYVTMPKDKKVELGFGGPAEEYALIQHEVDWYNHRVGEDHYLLNAIQAYSGVRALRKVVAEIEGAFKTKWGHAKKASDIPTSPWRG